jgi:hypothetical protein
MSFKELVLSGSKRQRFIYVMLVSWVILGIVGGVTGADLQALAEYFNAFYPYALAYLGAETLRPHGTNTLQIPKIK